MAINLDRERLITLREAVRRLPSGTGDRRLHISTIYRWTARGVGGVRLETLRVGGRLVTSVEAIQRFAERCSGIGSRPVQRGRSLKSRAAESLLDEAGIYNRKEVCGDGSVVQESIARIR